MIPFSTTEARDACKEYFERSENGPDSWLQKDNVPNAFMNGVYWAISKFCPEKVNPKDRTPPVEKPLHMQWNYDRDMPVGFFISMTEPDIQFPGLGFKPFGIKCDWKLKVGDVLINLSNKRMRLTVIRVEDTPNIHMIIVKMESQDPHSYFPKEYCDTPWVFEPHAKIIPLHPDNRA